MKVKELLQALNEATPKRDVSPKEMRLAVQNGTVDVPTGFALRSAFKKIILKHAVGPDWELKRNFLDTGLYYTGEDMQEASRVVHTIIGDLYGFFQDGPKREITRVVKQDEPERTGYVVKPVNQPSQIQFFSNKAPGPDGAVLGILMNPKR